MVYIFCNTASVASWAVLEAATHPGWSPGPSLMTYLTYENSAVTLVPSRTPLVLERGAEALHAWSTVGH